MGGRGLTQGGQSPGWTPWGRQSLCSPRCEGRPIGSAGTPGRPVDCHGTKTLKSATASQPSRLDDSEAGRRERLTCSPQTWERISGSGYENPTD